MSITSDSLSATIWAYIVSALQAEMNVGPTGPGTGPNTTGRLQTVQYVHSTIHLWSDELPVVGVQLVSQERKQIQQRRQRTVLEFTIACAARATKDPTSGLITLDNAMASLRTIMEDGSGNGVIPILCDPYNVTCGTNGSGQPNAMFAWIEGHIKYDCDVDKAAGTTDARAYAFIPYFVETRTTN